MPTNPTRAPEPFSLSPLLSLMPNIGNPARLEDLASALFVHYETVEGVRQSSDSAEVSARCGAELAMLRQVLDWLSAQRDEGAVDE